MGIYSQVLVVASPLTRWPPAVLGPVGCMVIYVGAGQGSKG